MPTRPDKFSGTKTYVSSYFNSLAGFLKQTDGQHPAKSGLLRFGFGDRSGMDSRLTVFSQR
jgi:hypothetical protein